MDPRPPADTFDSALPSASPEPTRSLFFQHDFRGSVLRIRPTGPNLGQREAAILNTEVVGLIANLGPKLRTLLLDLSDVHSMASFGLGVCIEVRNAAHARGARTMIYGLNSQLEALFRLMKVDRLYTMVRTTNELAKALAA